jgi:diguanylate cyclase (GGDEF)-like protein/PAS domain S-box-containing protein
MSSSSDARDSMRVAALNEIYPLPPKAQTALQRLLDLARDLFGVPKAALTVVDPSEEAVLVGSEWPDEPSPAAYSLTAEARERGTVVVYEDASEVGRLREGHAPWEDPGITFFGGHPISSDGSVVKLLEVYAGGRFANNPWVGADDGLRFFAAAPVAVKDGVVIGAFCVGAPHRMTLSTDKQQRLSALAQQAGVILDTHRTSREDTMVRRAVAHSADAVLILEDNGADVPSVVWMNDAYLELNGARRETLLGEPFPMMQSNRLEEETREQIANAVATNTPQRGETRLSLGTGTTSTIAWSLAPVPDDSDTVTHWVSIQRDVTEDQIKEKRLQYRADHDALTTLLNRESFMEWVEQVVGELPPKPGEPDESSPGLCAVLYLDLDGFKQVNDTLGHHCGDLYLVAVAEILDDSIRQTDKAARMSGDEFALGFSNLQAPSDARMVAERTCNALCRTVYVDGHAVDISASAGLVVGLSEYPSADAVFQAADDAMYRAKERKHPGVTLYDANINQMIVIDRPS